MEQYFHFSFCMLVKPLDATPSIHFQVNLTYGICQITGQLVKLSSTLSAINVIVPYVNAIRLKIKLTSTHPAIIHDAFKGHQGNDLQKLFHDNHLPSPSNCTDRLQPIDISTNKPVKDHLRKCFTSWYTEQVQKQLLNGTVVEDVKVDLHLSVLEAKWIVSVYDYLCANTSFGYNGFKQVGLTHALEFENNQDM